MSGCVLHKCTAAWLKPLYLSPALRLCSYNHKQARAVQNNSPEMMLLLLFFWFCDLERKTNQDPIFNFTSYLGSADGCKLILWQRAATVPIRGSILSEARSGIRSSCGEDRGRSQPEWGRVSRNKRALAPAVSKSKLIHKSPQRGEKGSSAELIKVVPGCWENTLKSNAAKPSSLHIPACYAAVHRLLVNNLP